MKKSKCADVFKLLPFSTVANSIILLLWPAYILYFILFFMAPFWHQYFLQLTKKLLNHFCDCLRISFSENHKLRSSHKPMRKLRANIILLPQRNWIVYHMSKGRARLRTHISWVPVFVVVKEYMSYLFPGIYKLRMPGITISSFSFLSIDFLKVFSGPGKEGSHSHWHISLNFYTCCMHIYDFVL